MKAKIIILSVLKYVDKKTNETKTRLGFIFDDEQYNVSNKSFKGYSELSCFYTGDVVFETITKDMIKKPLECVIRVEQSASNPLKTNSKIEKVSYAGSVYNLL